MRIRSSWNFFPPGLDLSARFCQGRDRRESNARGPADREPCIRVPAAARPPRPPPCAPGAAGRSERTVPREVLADGSLIAMTRLCANRSEERFRARAGRTRPARHAGDFKPGLRTVARHEALPGETVSCILNRLAGCRQRRRPARSFPQAARPMEAPQDTASRNLSLQRARSGSKRQNPPLHLERTGSNH